MCVGGGGGYSPCEIEKGFPMLLSLHDMPNFPVGCGWEGGSVGRHMKT